VVGGELRHDLGVGLVGGGGRHDGKVGWAELQKWLDWNRGGRRAGQGALDLWWLPSLRRLKKKLPPSGRKYGGTQGRCCACLLVQANFFLKKKIAYAASLAKKKLGK
jgi:hypothetical protein